MDLRWFVFMFVTITCRCAIVVVVVVAVYETLIDTEYLGLLTGEGCQWLEVWI